MSGLWKAGVMCAPGDQLLAWIAIRAEVQLRVYQNHTEGLLKCWAQPTPVPVSDSVGLGRRQRICISDKLSSDADSADPRTTLGEPLL